MSQNMLFAPELAKIICFCWNTISQMIVYRSSVCPVCCQMHDLVIGVHVKSLVPTGVQSSSSAVLTEHLHIFFQNFHNTFMDRMTSFTLADKIKRNYGKQMFIPKHGRTYEQDLKHICLWLGHTWDYKHLYYWVNWLKNKSCFIYLLKSLSPNMTIPRSIIHIFIHTLPKHKMNSVIVCIYIYIYVNLKL